MGERRIAQMGCSLLFMKRSRGERTRRYCGVGGALGARRAPSMRVGDDKWRTSWCNENSSEKRLFRGVFLLSAEPAEPPHAPAEGAECLLKLELAEVRPGAPRDVELAVARLPEQEVPEPELPRSAD